MKSTSNFITCSLLFTFLTAAAFAAPRIETIPPATDNTSMSFAGLNNLTAEDFLALTPKKIKQQTGQKLSLKETIALKVAQKKIKKEIKKGNISEGKSQLVALLLAALVGILGIHRFYLGYTGIGIIQLLTLGGCGIWSLIDLIRIITGDLQPKHGVYEETL